MPNMQDFRTNSYRLSRPQVQALRAVKVGLDAGIMENAGPNLARKVLDSLHQYGKDGQGKSMAIQEEFLQAALGVLQLDSYEDLIAKLPELELMGAIVDPLTPPDPAESNLAIARAAL